MRLALILIVLFAQTALPAAGAEISSAIPLNSSSVATDVPPSTGRLRFKSAGPVCMCGEGMSERDIEAAMVRRGLAKPSSSSGSVVGNGGPNKATGDDTAAETHNQHGGIAR